MDILQQAEKYAEGKADQAITRAIAEAYAEGYRAGYNDRENEIPAEFRDDRTEYVDLGLPSGTLWAADCERRDGKIIYESYDEAKLRNLPTREQFEELLNVCKWVFIKDIQRHDCVGPNGAVITFPLGGGLKMSTNLSEQYTSSYFWLRTSGDTADNKKDAAVLNIYARIYVEDVFSGYHLPIRLVR